MSVTPVRTCVGCRQRAAKQDLLRVVVQDVGHGPQVVPDPAGRAAGRGAYIHPETGCLDQAVRRRAFARALRAPAAPDVERLRGHLGEQLAAGDQSKTDRRWSSSS